MPINSSRPTVLIYRTYLLPASETFIRSQARQLQKYRPHFVGCRKVAGIDVPAGEATLLNEGRLLGRARQAVFETTGASPTLDAVIHRLSPALVHAHFGLDACLVLPAALRYGVPLITTFHGYDITTTDHEWRRTRLGRSYLSRRPALQSEGTLFLAVSQFIKDKLIDRGFDPGKIRVQYIGVDTNFFKPDPSIPREPVVLFVGRLKENKGCAYLIRAMKEVEATTPDAKLVVIGDGPLRRQLEQEASGCLRAYTFLGTQSPLEIRRHLQTASVVCVPSVEIRSGESEGFGLVFCEAQACGTPVVSFAVGGIPEAVANGQTGFLVQERDWQGLAERISMLLHNQDLWRDFSRAGRHRVVNHFDLGRQTAALETIYSEVARVPAREAAYDSNLSLC